MNGGRLGLVFAWHALPWEHLLELVRHADSAGIEAVYVDGDVSMMPKRGDGDVLDGFTMTTALLASTGRVGIGSIRLPHHWHTAKLGQAVATWERLFPGRSRFLISTGGQPADARFGLVWRGMTERRAHLDETLDALRALWRGETVHRDGTYVKLAAAAVRPTPPPGRPEIEVASGVSPLLQVVARHADRWDMNVPSTPGRVAKAKAALAEACAGEGRDPAGIGTQLWVLARPAGGTASEALADLRRWYPWFDHIDDDEALDSIARGGAAACQDHLAAIRESGVDVPLADLTGLDLDAAHHAIDALCA
ncbi:MAG: hypothetical protein CL910_02520 [Deltaproteobacteria bacterium]|nr:hypothetical protein [Deltaproteobacteria bacterium]